MSLETDIGIIVFYVKVGF